MGNNCSSCLYNLINNNDYNLSRKSSQQQQKENIQIDTEFNNIKQIKENYYY